MATASLPVEPDEMECSVCHEHFKEPKVLPCGHVMCRHCLMTWLQSQAEALCPLCRCPIKEDKGGSSGKSLADIADSFLTDRAMAALVEAHRLLSEQHVCCVCVNVAAVSMCIDCGDMFCQHCSNVHKKQSVSKHHAVEQLTSLTEEKLAANQRRACAVHSDKLPEVFCPSHGASVCLRCATTVHRQCPDVKDLEERVMEARDTLHELTVILTARETEVGQDITRLDQQLTDIDQHTQAAIDELTATFDDIEAAEKESRRRLNDMIVKTSSDEKLLVSGVRNTQLGQRGKLTLHKRLVARSEAIITRDDVTDMTPDMQTLVKDLDRSISSQANVKVTSRIELAIDPAEVTRIKKALSKLGNGKGSSFDDGNTTRIKHLEQNVQQLQRDLNSAQSERARFAQQVTALQQELAGAQNRVQVLEQEVKRKGDQIKRNKAEIASCKVLSKVKEAPLMVTSVTQPSRPTHKQTKAFCFHDNHGKNVVLSEDQQAAAYLGCRFGVEGIVMSRDLLEVNKLYEVQMTKGYKRGGSLLQVGVVTSSPDSTTVPEWTGAWQRAVVIGSDHLSDHGERTETDIGKALDKLLLGSRVGLVIDGSRRLHLYFNGADQGVVPCRPLPDPCWALWELSSLQREECSYKVFSTDFQFTQIVSLPTTDK